MNINDNRQPHYMWHYSSCFLWQAKAMGTNWLTPDLIRDAERLYQENSHRPTPVASEVEDLGKGYFDLTRSVEVVPLGHYTDKDEMVRELRRDYCADAIRGIECDGRKIVGVSWYSGTHLTEGLHHVVTVIECGIYFYPMLIIAMRDGK